MTVSFAQLEQTEEYKHLKLLERVSLFDTVNVEFPALGVSATARAVKIVYDGLADRVKSVTLGSVRANIADTVASQQQQMSQTPTRTELQKTSAAATAWLTNGKGYKVERRDENGNTIDTLYMDTPDIDTAVNVLRIGQYYSAWTIDGVLDASWIKTGILTSQDGKIRIDLMNNMITVETLIKDKKGKIEFTTDGIIGYGWDSTRETFYSTLRIDPGGRTSESVEEFTMITSAGSEVGLAVSASKAGSTTIIGQALGKTEIEGNSIKIGYKTVSWKDNGDGTYTLIGQ